LNLGTEHRLPCVSTQIGLEEECQRTVDPSIASQSSVIPVMAVTTKKQAQINVKMMDNMRSQMHVTDWGAMFREIGLDQAQMERWHKLFEARHLADHQRFLEWLGLKPDEIDRIRLKSR
jgi:hypothetical protein